MLYAHHFFLQASGLVTLILEAEAKAKKSVCWIMCLSYKDLQQKSGTLLGTAAALTAETKDIFNVIRKVR